MTPKQQEQFYERFDRLLCNSDKPLDMMLKDCTNDVIDFINSLLKEREEKFKYDFQIGYREGWKDNCSKYKLPFDIQIELHHETLAQREFDKQNNLTLQENKE